MKEQHFIDTLREQFTKSDRFTMADIIGCFGGNGDSDQSIRAITSKLASRGDFIRRVRKNVYTLDIETVKESVFRSDREISIDAEFEKIQSLFIGYEDVYQRLLEEASRDIRSVRHELIYCVEKVCRERIQEQKVKQRLEESK